MADAPPAPHLPVAPISRLTRPLARFLRVESASGVVLLVCTGVALAMANSPAAGWWEGLWHTHVGIEVGGLKLEGELGHFLVNDVLMAVFFFVVGLEIKRELVAGELKDPRKAALPVAAALGGMIAPALVYYALQRGQPGERGWGVPMATDIAFVVGVMALLGPRVPAGLKVMLLSLAIADDIGAVTVIAVFYSTGLSWEMLGLAAAAFALTHALDRAGVRSVPVYVVVGAAAWLPMLKSGVHPTIASVVLGLMTPSSAWVGPAAFRRTVADVLARIDDERVEVEGPERELLAFAARESVSPLERLEVRLHPWVGFVIMPLFALANAGVAVRPELLVSPVALAVAAGLFLGKPAGVVLFSLLAVRSGVARLPDGVSWVMVLGGGFLAGIGFTMSLFVAGLALEGDLLAAGKVGTLCGSAASAAAGAAVLAWAVPTPGRAR
jgi:NhaA family Na+:H+ antiporter